MQRIHPAGAQDQVCAAALLDGLFTRQLGGAIDVQRRRGVVFLPGARAFTVEHIVGGVMHQQRAMGLAPVGQHGRHVGVQHPGQLLLLGLGLVHRRVGGRVHHHIGLDAVQQPARGLGIGQVQVVDGDRHHFAQRLQRADQLPAHLPGGSRHYEFHGCPSA